MPMVRASVRHLAVWSDKRSGLTTFARRVSSVDTCAAFADVSPHSAIVRSICSRRFENNPINSGSTPSMSARPSCTDVHATPSRAVSS